jgi:ParB/RepB/Spo0J family partition protein
VNRGKLIQVAVPKCRVLTRNPQYLTPHQMDALKTSIARDGFLVPILVRPHDDYYEVLSGNHRFLCAQELDLPRIPALEIHCTDEEARRIAVNLNTIHGEPDPAALAPFLADLDDELLGTIHLADDCLKALRDFDGELATRLDELQPVDAVNQDSQPQIPNCRCDTCGRLHIAATAPAPSA